MNALVKGAMILTMTSSLLCANPNGFPEYERDITVEYASPEAADAAQLSIRELPVGKKMAFSLRWDDANPRHLKQRAAFVPHGYRANFNLNGDMKPLFRELIADGCTIGNHTIHHPYLNFCNLNEIFYEIQEQRVRLESYLNIPVSVFVMPSSVEYGISANTDIKREFLDQMGRIIRFGGHLGGNDSAAIFGLEPEYWIQAQLFAIGDTDPKPEIFRQKIADFEKSLDNGVTYPGGPIIMLGVHSWQTDEGFKRLEREVYAPYAHRKDWWYCNLTEYLAYRYQYLHTSIRKMRVDGSKVTYRLKGCSAAELASNVPLTLEGAQVIRSVSSNDSEVKAEGNTVIIGPAEGHRVPEHIEYLKNGAENGIGGLKMTLAMNGDDVQLEVRNCSGEAIRDLSLVLRLPPVYAELVQRLAVSELAAGSSRVFTVKPGAKNSFPFAGDGVPRFYCQADYQRGKAGYRTHVMMTLPEVSANAPSPNTCSAVLGAIEGNAVFPEGYLARMSTLGTTLENLGSHPAEQWHAIEKKGFCRIGVHPYSSQKGWEIKRDDANKVKNIYVLEVESPEAGKVNLFHFPWKCEVYCNGVCYSSESRDPFVEITVKAGWNRVLIVLHSEAWNMDAAWAVCMKRNPMEFLKCRSVR